MLESVHSFHIPVMGLAFTIDSPLKVAKYGISSVISIIDDVLIEDMRKHYSHEYGIEYKPISQHEEDFRAKRITAYLTLVEDEVNRQFALVRAASLDQESDLTKYLEMLDDHSNLKKLYKRYCTIEIEEEKHKVEIKMPIYLY